MLAARVDVHAFDCKVTHAGEKREVEELGELGTDLASIGIHRVAPGDNEIERPFPRRARRPARVAVANVSDPANAGSVMCTPSMSTPRSSPHAIASRNVSSASGGPSVITVTCEPVRSDASSTALLTARLQYGFISASMPSRRSRPSDPSSISSNFGICFTNTAMRTDVLRLSPMEWRPAAVASRGCRFPS